MSKYKSKIAKKAKSRSNIICLCGGCTFSCSGSCDTNCGGGCKGSCGSQMSNNPMW